MTLTLSSELGDAQADNGIAEKDGSKVIDHVDTQNAFQGWRHTFPGYSIHAKVMSGITFLFRQVKLVNHRRRLSLREPSPKQ